MSEAETEPKFYAVEPYFYPDTHCFNRWQLSPEHGAAAKFSNAKEQQEFLRRNRAWRACTLDELDINQKALLRIVDLKDFAEKLVREGRLADLARVLNYLDNNKRGWDSFFEGFSPVEGSNPYDSGRYYMRGHIKVRTCNLTEFLVHSELVDELEEPCRGCSGPNCAPWRWAMWSVVRRDDIG